MENWCTQRCGSPSMSASGVVDVLAPQVTPWKAVLKKRLFIRRDVCSQGHSVIALLLTLPCGPGPQTPVTYAMLRCSILPWNINWATRCCCRAVITGFIYCCVMVPPITASSGDWNSKLACKVSQSCRGYGEVEVSYLLLVELIFEGKMVSFTRVCSETLTTPWTARFTSSVVVKEGLLSRVIVNPTGLSCSAAGQPVKTVMSSLEPSLLLLSNKQCWKRRLIKETLNVTSKDSVIYAGVPRTRI